MERLTTHAYTIGSQIQSFISTAFKAVTNKSLYVFNNVPLLHR